MEWVDLVIIMGFPIWVFSFGLSEYYTEVISVLDEQLKRPQNSPSSIPSLS